MRGFTPEALALLSAYDFPGNVRELENEVKRAFTLADADDYITPELLSEHVRRACRGAAPATVAPCAPPSNVSKPS